MDHSKDQSPVEAHQQDKENKYKSSDQFVFRKSNFKFFSKGQTFKEFYSEIKQINGLEWKLFIKFNDIYFGFYLQCYGQPKDMAWSCQASWKFSVVSCTKSIYCLTEKGTHLFSAMDPIWRNANFATFEELVNPKNDFYNAEEDAMTFHMEVTVQKPRGMPEIRDEDTLLVNGAVVYVNKHLLAAHSEFFRKLFFGENAEGMPKIVIDDIENGIENFQRLISTMYPTNFELSDDCVENVLLLANRFLLDSVEHLCVDFLMTKSQKSAICKFRLAHQFSIIGMKKKVLEDIKKKDFDVAGSAHYEMLSEHSKLDAEAATELKERYEEIFSENPSR